MHIHLVRPAWGQGKHFHMFEGTPPLGLAYLGAVLERAGHRVSVRDAIAEGWDHVVPYGPMLARGLSNADVVAGVPADAGAVGISLTSTTDWPLTVDLIARLRAARPLLPIVLGGEHPSALPRFCLLTSEADVVVLGEGEETAVELFGLLDRLSLDEARRGALARIDGIGWKDGDGIYRENAARARVRDLESLPLPAWHLFDVELYQKLHFVGGSLITGRRSLPILASRGCPYQCTFCTAPNMWAPVWIPRSATSVVDEMETLKARFGVSDFSMQDLTTVIRRDWIEDFCNELLARKLDVSWQLHSGTRLEQLDVPLLGLMKRAGLAYLAVAPESRSEETRRRIKKKMRTDDIDRAIAAGLAVGLPLKVQVMTGLPDDGVRDAAGNVAFAARLGWLGVDAIGTAIFAPYPGTELFDELLAKGDLVFDERCVFFPVANNNFVEPILRSQRLGPWTTKGFQFATLGAFLAAKTIRHPLAVARSAFHAATRDVEEVFFEKMLKALAQTVLRLARSPVTGAPVTWPPIDYARFSPEELSRKRRNTVPPPTVRLRTRPANTLDPPSPP